MAVLLHLAADMVWHFEVRIALVMWRESIMVELKHKIKNEQADDAVMRRVRPIASLPGECGHKC